MNDLGYELKMYEFISWEDEVNIISKYFHNYDNALTAGIKYYENWVENELNQVGLYLNDLNYEDRRYNTIQEVREKHLDFNRKDCLVCGWAPHRLDNEINYIFEIVPIKSIHYEDEKEI